MTLGLVEDDPATRPAAAAVEGAAQIHSEHGSGLGVRPRGSWTRVEVSVQHLGNDVLGRAQDVVVGRLATSCIGCHRGDFNTRRPSGRVAPPTTSIAIWNRPSIVPYRPRNDANRRESTDKPACWRSFATTRDAPSGFRFRYRKVWGFKSLLVHSLALWASGALAGTWGDYVSACGVAFVSKSLHQRRAAGLCGHSQGLLGHYVSACGVAFVSKFLLVHDSEETHRSLRVSRVVA